MLDGEVKGLKPFDQFKSLGTTFIATSQNKDEKCQYQQCYIMFSAVFRTKFGVCQK